jgi:site-specific DNA-methyltransferase (adenine-specific)
MTPLLTAGLNYVYHARAESLLRWLPDNSVDIVVTSPPYNVDWQVKNGQGRGMMKGSRWVENFSEGYENYSDKQPEDAYQNWLRIIVGECLRVSRGLVWVNHKTRYRMGEGIHPLSFLRFPFWAEVIWDRGGSIVLNAKKFAPSHEFVYGFGTPHYWDDNSNKLMSVWRIVPINRDDGHPCPYPEQLVERLITASCPEGGVVFDPFMGSGTTAAVAQRLNRRYLGCDISAEYVELANKRLDKPYTLPMFAA